MKPYLKLISVVTILAAVACGVIALMLVFNLVPTESSRIILTKVFQVLGIGTALSLVMVLMMDFTRRING